MKKLIPDIIMSDLTVTCKKQALHAMVMKVTERYGGKADSLIYSLLEREKIGSTGIWLWWWLFHMPEMYGIE